VVYDGDFGTNVVLIYTFLMVSVSGRNLPNVILALESGTAEFIQEFDPDKWSKPADASAPFIQSIEVVAKNRDEAIADAEELAGAVR
jgi:hypothetical protein